MWRNTLYAHGRIPTPDESNEDAEGAKTIRPTTQNKVRQAVFTALQWAVDMGLLPYHPGTGVRRVAEGRNDRPIFEREELGKLFSIEWPDPRAFAACMLAAETGMRLGEVRGLQVKNLHLETGHLDVLTNFQDAEGLKAPKWDSTRLRVSISPRCAMALRAVLEKHRYGAREDDFVFWSSETDRRPLSKEAIGGALQRAMRAAGLASGRTFHSFRHSWITHASGQLPAHVLQQLVGHSNDATTARYQHVSDEQRKAVAEYTAKIIPFEKAT